MAALALGVLAAACAGAVIAPRAPAQSALEKFNAVQSKINEASSREGVLTTTISRYNDHIDELRGQVAELRNREAVVVARLQKIQAELNVEEQQLATLREQLKRSIAALSDRLVDIYKSNDPDILTVVLDSKGFDDLLERSDYLQRIQNQESDFVGRVRELRNQTQQIVDRITAQRDEVAAQKAELDRTRAQLQSRSAEFAQARAKQRKALASTREHRDDLEGDLSEISKQVQEQLLGSSPLPAGPIHGAAGGFIWPVNGPITSGFGFRWGRMHEGVDIGVPAGTPIRAAKAGTVVLAGPTGGYGNYTCIDHGGGLSTCYAHQSSFARTSGPISQGDVLGYVGCTGHCFGDHLHFEIRFNGEATDPLAYL
ncbi:MAG: murein hydrolase activator EnvC family protein [Solirubrobacterales bacterium]